MDEYNQTEILCRIKGKILKNNQEVYNPLAVGDKVEYTKNSENEGVIHKREVRRNAFSRWNEKKELPQTIFSNFDLICCVTSLQEPVFNPGFIDRVLLCAGGEPVSIIVNKVDLVKEDLNTLKKDIELYENLGLKVYYISALDNIGLDDLKNDFLNKRIALFGQSGVGKSTLINKLIPNAEQKTSQVSTKYLSGRHTTNFSKLIIGDDEGMEIIDTPGVREIEIPPMESYEIGYYYPEMIQFIPECKYSACLHDKEPECAVKHAVNTGLIDKDRYKRYVSILRANMQRLKKMKPRDNYNG